MRDNLFTRRELEVASCLKELTIQETADKLKIRRSTVDSYLSRMRDKITVARNTSNIAANWLDSGRNPRLAKLLRRQG